jgi:hypothetical protein
MSCNPYGNHKASCPYGAPTPLQESNPNQDQNGYNYRTIREMPAKSVDSSSYMRGVHFEEHCAFVGG